MRFNGVVLEGVLPIFYKEIEKGRFIFCREDGEAITEPKNLKQAESYLLEVWKGLVSWKNKDYLKKPPLIKLEQAHQFLESYLWNMKALGYKSLANNKKLRKELEAWEKVSVKDVLNRI